MAMNFIKDCADKVGMGSVVDKIEEAGVKQLGKLFKPMLEAAVENTLKDMGPKAGQIAADKMSEKYSQLKKVAGAQDAAVKAASDAIMSFKDDILDFVDEASEAPKEAFRKVGVLLLRAMREAADMAVPALVAVLPCCMPCCVRCLADLKEITTNIFNSIVESLKSTVDGELKKKHVPQPILDEIKWDFAADDEVGEPQKRRAAGAPAAQTMGAAAEGEGES